MATLMKRVDWLVTTTEHLITMNQGLIQPPEQIVVLVPLPIVSLVAAHLQAVIPLIFLFQSTRMWVDPSMIAEETGEQL